MPSSTVAAIVYVDPAVNVEAVGHVKLLFVAFGAGAVPTVYNDVLVAVCVPTVNVNLLLAPVEAPVGTLNCKL